MKKILWLAPCAPYDRVQHAGGKIFNRLLKKFHSDGRFEIRVAAFCNVSELSRLDLDSYGIQNKTILEGKSGTTRAIESIVNLESRINPYNRNANYLSNTRYFYMRSHLRDLQRSGYLPDIVILHWTEIVCLAPLIRHLFSNSKLICIEEDVTFLKRERQWRQNNNPFLSKLHELRFNKGKKLEIQCLSLSDLTVINNPKDQQLLLDNGLACSRTFVCSPSFMNMSHIQRNCQTKDILFFGFMGRKDNYLSAQWFIENVFNLIQDSDVRFLILGSSPPLELINMKTERIKILGFIEDVEPYFAKSLCLVAPIVMGAGIKIKVLEGLSSGIPVLTNSLGIEGINAERDKDYYHCESPKDYLEVIGKLLADNSKGEIIGANGKKYIEVNNNVEKSTKDFLNIVDSI